jgi:hypothetical protein
MRNENSSEDEAWNSFPDVDSASTFPHALLALEPFLARVAPKSIYEVPETLGPSVSKRYARDRIPEGWKTSTS